MADTATPSVLHRSYSKVTGFFEQFPLITHSQINIAKDESLKQDVKSFYKDLKNSFKADTIYPLTKQDITDDIPSKTLFLSSLNHSKKSSIYNACTPEDTVALKDFLSANKLNPPFQSLDTIIDYSQFSTFCIITIDVNTLQIPLIIDNTTGSPILNEEDYQTVPEIEDEEELKSYQEKQETDLEDKESGLRAYRSYTLILYLAILMNVDDLEKRMKYFDCINESYLTKNNIFPLLNMYKCAALSKFIQLNMSHKRKFIMEVSLKLWDGFNWVFKKTGQLEKDVEVVKLKYLNYKILNKDVDDETVESIIECVENDDLLSKIRDDLEIKF